MSLDGTSLADIGQRFTSSALTTLSLGEEADTTGFVCLWNVGGVENIATRSLTLTVDKGKVLVSGVFVRLDVSIDSTPAEVATFLCR